MATYYELPGGLTWVKNNLHVIIGNKSLEEIMHFGDTWRDRGHTPLVHVISPSMDNGRMWDDHIDPSGLLDNVTSHIDMFIVDFYNRNEPELPKTWWTKKWLLWEYSGGKVKFNGDYGQCVRTFGVDPEDLSTQPPADGGGSTSGGGTTGGGVSTDVNIHLSCPHCGVRIF